MIFGGVTTSPVLIGDSPTGKAGSLKNPISGRSGSFISGNFKAPKKPPNF